MSLMGSARTGAPGPSRRCPEVSDDLFHIRCSNAELARERVGAFALFSRSITIGKSLLSSDRRRYPLAEPLKRGRRVGLPFTGERSIVHS